MIPPTASSDAHPTSSLLRRPTPCVILPPRRLVVGSNTAGGVHIFLTSPLLRGKGTCVRECVCPSARRRHFACDLPGAAWPGRDAAPGSHRHRATHPPLYETRRDAAATTPRSRGRLSSTPPVSSCTTTPPGSRKTFRDGAPRAHRAGSKVVKRLDGARFERGHEKTSGDACMPRSARPGRAGWRGGRSRREEQA